MNVCKTCKYWCNNREMFDSLEQDVCNPVDPDTYKYMVMPYDVGICRHPKQGFCEFPVMKNGFSLADGSTYFACLSTAEEFGCVLHEFGVY